MKEGLLLKPPEIMAVVGNVLFLGGPIQGAPDWQSEAVERIHTLNSDVTIASPRKDYKPSEFVYEYQVDWETHFLNRAARYGGIMFWLAKQVKETPGRAYAQTSRFELGEWKRQHQISGTKLAVGIEEGFGNARYIRRRFAQDCPDVPILDNLADTCAAMVEMLG